ncbi:MAG: hypothetical protein J0I94_13680 [Thiobacillus sp.]|nr:hypothetical protein [Thiobacillus sp.]
MTSQPDSMDVSPLQEQASLSCVMDSTELLRVRLLPAQFARALGVSKQSVSRWVRDGWVTPGADGRIDPEKAIAQLLRRCDPGRLRARWLRQAVGEVQALRDGLAAAENRAEAAEAKLAEAKEDLLLWKQEAQNFERSLYIFVELVANAAERLRALPDTEWTQILDGLLDQAINQSVDECHALAQAEDGLSAADLADIAEWDKQARAAGFT